MDFVNNGLRLILALALAFCFLGTSCSKRPKQGPLEVRPQREEKESEEERQKREEAKRLELRRDRERSSFDYKNEKDEACFSYDSDLRNKDVGDYTEHVNNFMSYKNEHEDDILNDMLSFGIEIDKNKKKSWYDLLRNYLVHGNSSIEDAEVILLGEQHTHFENIKMNYSIGRKLHDPRISKLIFEFKTFMSIIWKFDPGKSTCLSYQLEKLYYSYYFSSHQFRYDSGLSNGVRQILTTIDYKKLLGKLEENGVYSPIFKDDLTGENFDPKTVDCDGMFRGLIVDQFKDKGESQEVYQTTKNIMLDIEYFRQKGFKKVIIFTGMGHTPYGDFLSSPFRRLNQKTSIEDFYKYFNHSGKNHQCPFGNTEMLYRYLNDNHIKYAELVWKKIIEDEYTYPILRNNGDVLLDDELKGMEFDYERK